MKKTVFTALLITLLTMGVSKAEELKVAAVIGNVPFEFEDQNGQWIGFEIDMIKAIGEKTGKKITFVPMPFNSIFSAVQSGRADVAIGTVAVTEKRLESVAFTQPYYDADQCLTTSSNGKIKGLDDLKGQPVAVLTGTIGEIWATGHNEQYKFGEIRRYDSVLDPMLDIATGRINAFIHDCPIDAYYIKGKPQYAIVATIPTNEKQAMIMKKGSPLLEELNQAISEMKQNGEFTQLHKKWFDIEPNPESSTVKVLPIPQP